MKQVAERCVLGHPGVSRLRLTSGATDLYLQTLFNTDNFAAQGMPMETRWDTSVAATNDGWWLDPRGKDFGPNGQYYNHDLAEAKKLLAAAGFANGFETLSNYVTGPELPTAKHAEVIDGFISELGIKSTVNAIDYAKEYQPRYRTVMVSSRAGPG